MMQHQISMYEIADLDPDHGHKPGEYVQECGRVICHIMRPSYVGSLVLYDISSTGHTEYMVGRLEQYFFNEDAGCWRSVIYDGHRQWALIDHRNGRNIYELAEDTERWRQRWRKR